MTLQAAALAAYASHNATALAGGFLDLLNSGGSVLAVFNLNTPSAGTSSGPVTTFAGFPKSASGTAGTVASARLRTSTGADFRTGIPVGIPGSGAPVIVDNGVGTLVITGGQTVTVAAGPTLTMTAA